MNSQLNHLARLLNSAVPPTPDQPSPAPPPPIYSTLYPNPHQPSSPIPGQYGQQGMVISRLMDLDTKDHHWLDLFIQYFVSPVPQPTGMTDHPGHSFSNTQNGGGGGEMDDLLFFVRYPHASNRHLEEVFVKRKTGNAVPPLDDLIAWKETFFLNLIVHTDFVMNVCICTKVTSTTPTRPPPRVSSASVSVSGASVGQQSTIRRPSPKRTMRVLKSIERRVYASPHKVRMDTKHHETSLSYPVIYFCVNDFEDAFQGLTISQGEYLTVELQLPVPLSLGTVETVDMSGDGGDGVDESDLVDEFMSEDPTQEATPLKTKRRDREMLTLFQGAVPYSALLEVYQAKSSAFQSGTLLPNAIKQFQRLSRSFFGAFDSHSQAGGVMGPSGGGSGGGGGSGVDGDEEMNVFIQMRGPGGKGHAQVAITPVPSTVPNKPTDYHNNKEGEEETDQQNGWQKISRVFSPPLTKSLGEKSNKNEEGDGEVDDLECKMTYVNLPWTSIIKDLLDAFPSGIL